MRGVFAGRIRAEFRRRRGDFELDVSLDLPASGVTAIFGPSGSGKTSLLRHMAGFERAKGGFLSVNGDIWQDETAGAFVPVHERPLAYVFQEASLFSHLTVQGNLDFGLKRVPVANRQVPLERTIDLLDLKALLNRRVDTLSGGERQRVAIARALVVSPRLLLMDEPLASLDGARKAEILPYLERLQGQFNIPVLYVSHAPDEVARLADHLVLLDAGRVTACGPTREIMTRLDLPMAHGDSAAAIIEASVSELEPQWHLSHADFEGGRISLLNPTLMIGQRVRLRIQARDVSITLVRQSGTSVQNILPVRVTGLAADLPGQVMVSLDAAGRTLLARVTLKSANALGLEPGKAVFAQVKGVAVLG